MADVQAHLFKYKLETIDDHGNPKTVWIPIPVMFQTMYQAYLSYCLENNIANPLTEQEYFIGISNAGNLSDLLDNEGTIIIERGGTGANNATGARANLDVYSKEETHAAINDALYGDTEEDDEGSETSLVARIKTLEQTVVVLQQNIAALQNKKLEDFGISKGQSAPNETTKGSIYFRY